MKKIKTRLKACWNILFNYNHFVIINVDKENILRLITDKQFEIKGSYLGFQPYVYNKLIKSLAADKDDIDMVLDKAQFEADAQQFKNK